MRRFSEAGLRPDTHKGQNFLIDLNLLGILADAADLGPQDVVLEIGTGLGGLTALMSPRVAAVVTVEVDEAGNPVNPAVSTTPPGVPAPARAPIPPRVEAGESASAIFNRMVKAITEKNKAR